MFFTQNGLINALRAMGFRGISFKNAEPPGTVEVTISGFGRFRRLEPLAVIVFRQEKPITAKLRIVRKFFSFRLWEVEI